MLVLRCSTRRDVMSEGIHVELPVDGHEAHRVPTALRRNCVRREKANNQNETAFTDLSLRRPLLAAAWPIGKGWAG